MGLLYVMNCMYEKYINIYTYLDIMIEYLFYIMIDNFRNPQNSNIANTKVNDEGDPTGLLVTQNQFHILQVDSFYRFKLYDYRQCFRETLIVVHRFDRKSKTVFFL